LVDAAGRVRSCNAPQALAERLLHLQMDSEALRVAAAVLRSSEQGLYDR
jgi:hypothetical protein